MLVIAREMTKQSLKKISDMWEVVRGILLNLDEAKHCLLLKGILECIDQQPEDFEVRVKCYEQDF